MTLTNEKLTEYIMILRDRNNDLPDRNNALAKKVEMLEARLEKLERGSGTRTSSSSSTPSGTLSYLEAVAGSTGLLAAAEKLGVEEKHLKEWCHENLRDHHYAAEKWQYAAKRALGVEFKEPKTPEKVAAYSAEYWAKRIVNLEGGISDAAKEEGTSANFLKTYLHKEGFDYWTYADKPGDWKLIAQDYLNRTITGKTHKEPIEEDI